MASGRPSFTRWLAEYSAHEQNVIDISRSSVEAVLGANPSPVELVRHFYRDKLSQMQTNAHAYSETGSLRTSVLLHRGTVKELFPVPTREVAEQLLGLPLGVVRWLVDQRLLLLIIQRPERYRELEFLHPLLQAEYAPACYELRDRAIYDWLAGGDYAAHLRRASERHRLLFARPFPLALQEPYERLTAESEERSRQRNHQRYAALGALMGLDALDEVLSIPTRREATDEAVEAAQRRFFFLHRYVVHPITQGLGGLPYVAAPGGDPRLGTRWARIGDELERQLGEAVSLHLPRAVTPRLIEQVHASSLPDQYESLERRLLADRVWDDIEEASAVTSQVAEVVGRLEETAARFDTKYVGRGIALLRISAVGGAIGLARVAPEASAVVGAGAALPRSAVAATVDAIHRAFRRTHLPWQYWHLGRVAASVATRSPRTS
jgi:hypothetical protein